MEKKENHLDRFADLTWDNLNECAGSRIVSRGRSYQQQGRVSELAATSDGDLIAWVEGSKRYATKVSLDEDGLPNSICTCPYEFDCKHGVAVLLEIARILDITTPKYGVDIVFFDAEDFGTYGRNETWALGSEAFAQKAVKTYHPEFAILLDLIGDADQQIYIEQNSYEYAKRQSHRAIRRLL